MFRVFVGGAWVVWDDSKTSLRWPKPTGNLSKLRGNFFQKCYNDWVVASDKMLLSLVNCI